MTGDLDKLTPSQIVAELDRYIVGQTQAKKAVAVAIRNRIRRRKLPEDMQEEIVPKNILMIGPTGCGKTEIARRMSRLMHAPFIKVEATKYTEVGYVGRDVESMVRDLLNTAIALVKKEFRAKVETEAQAAAQERLLELLLPSGTAKSESNSGGFSDLVANLSSLGSRVQTGIEEEKAKTQPVDPEEAARKTRARESMRQKLIDGSLEDREVELDVQAAPSPMVQVLSGHNMEEIDMQMQNMLGDLMPKKNKKRKIPISEARKILLNEEIERLVDQDRVISEAIRRTEQTGIVFIDEMDKICGKHSGAGPDVSREGVQRDLLPIVEGATITTRHGPVKTDHVLFIAAGAFHQSKPSDLIPELQGRFPIRVELEKLTESDFRQILVGPRNSLTQQAVSLLSTEGVHIEFAEDGLDELALFAHRINEETENIGARRLHTIMERLLEEISFNAPDLPADKRSIRIDRSFVQERMRPITEDRDLSRYIL
ncbi:MAG: ATP-dependent protease ATPase subunit HslU [Leptospirales bacterium]|nr:ATP-dependent protease ATPase subunit HslU [Leptospirales bacterium]